ncbi:PAQR family membrane homeostasis protein TrhA [Robinsoniella sp. KNHs210]|uniref:PAQR family membrane homeostasis protein TrhA n=1 Tax=Robinsoniella sp. KNHs210 TaxID=1469950 RepID=UPI0005C7B6C3|nr:hemolysin III family protein [Robinsoniella sp. KNHs210]
MNQTATITQRKFRLKDPGSAITHFIGMVMAIFAAMPLLIKTAVMQPDRTHIVSLSIFIISMIMLYAASATYHSLDLTTRTNRILRKLDHCMIFVLIAGTYTPICMIVLNGPTGNLLCTIVWGIAIVGIIIKMCWITCPKWFSSILYIGMGWVCVLAFTQIVKTLPAAGFGWLLAGGIIYTAGGIIYALKLPIFDSKHKNFGSHEIFHLFVMGGSICHFILMYVYVAGMAI